MKLGNSVNDSRGLISLKSNKPLIKTDIEWGILYVRISLYKSANSQG